MTGVSGQDLAALTLPLHRRRRSRVSLLTIHAPVAQVVEGDRLAGHGAAHEGARAEDTKIAVKKFNLRFACVDWTPLEICSLHGSRFDCSMSYKRDKGAAS